MHGGGRRLGQGLEDQKSSRRRDTLGRGTECEGSVTVLIAVLLAIVISKRKSPSNKNGFPQIVHVPSQKHGFEAENAVH